jgi:hypothetical protein
VKTTIPVIARPNGMRQWRTHRSSFDLLRLRQHGYWQEVY